MQQGDRADAKVVGVCAFVLAGLRAPDHRKLLKAPARTHSCFHAKLRARHHSSVGDRDRPAPGVTARVPVRPNLQQQQKNLVVRGAASLVQAALQCRPCCRKLILRLQSHPHPLTGVHECGGYTVYKLVRSVSCSAHKQPLCDTCWGALVCCVCTIAV